DVRNGRIVLADASDATRTLQVEDITATLTPTRPGARVTLRGRSAQLGEVRVDATLESLSAIATAPLRVELEARCANFARLYPWLPAAGGLQLSGQTRLTANIKGRPTDCEVDGDLDLKNGGMAWRDQIRATAPLSVSLHGRWGAQGLAAATGTMDVA